jgi:hypothetical protein
VEERLRAVVVPCLGLWALLFSLGLLNEGRSWSRQFEQLRLLVLVPGLLTAVHWMGDSVPLSAWVAAGVYIAGSMVWLEVAHRQAIKSF